MNPTLYRLLTTLLLAAGIATLTGCPKKPTPTPADTVIGLSQVSTSGTQYDQVQDSFSFDYSSGSQDVYSEDLPIEAVPELRDQSLQNARYVPSLLPSIYFDFDQSFVKADERFKLIEAADHLKSHPNDQLLIEGYCDWRGTTEYNLGLGDRRASSVKVYLQQLGINSQRVQILSKGDLEAIVSGTQEQMAHDRRTDLIVLR